MAEHMDDAVTFAAFLAATLAVTLWFVLLPTISQQFLAHKCSDTTSPVTRS